MSANQTQFIALSGWPTANDLYSGPPGSGSLPNNDFTVSMMLQSLRGQRGFEVLMSGYDSTGADSGFAVFRTQSAGFIGYALQVGEDPNAFELLAVTMTTATAVGRPIVLTFTLEGLVLNAYVNGGFVATLTLAHAFVSAGTALQLGGAGTQIPGAAATQHTGILGAALAYNAFSPAEVRQHAVASMAAHQMTDHANNFDHMWSMANNALRGVPTTLADVGRNTPITLTAVGALPTNRVISDVAYCSPFYAQA